MKARAERDGYAVVTHGTVMNGEDLWVSTVSKDGTVLQRRMYTTPEQAIAGHAKLVTFYLDEESA